MISVCQHSQLVEHLHQHNIQPVDKQQCGEIKDSTGERKLSGGEQSRSTLKGGKTQEESSAKCCKIYLHGETTWLELCGESTRCVCMEKIWKINRVLFSVGWKYLQKELPEIYDDKHKSSQRKCQVHNISKVPQNYA